MTAPQGCSTHKFGIIYIILHLCLQVVRVLCQWRTLVCHPIWSLWRVTCLFMGQSLKQNFVFVQCRAKHQWESVLYLYSRYVSLMPPLFLSRHLQRYIVAHTICGYPTQFLRVLTTYSPWLDGKHTVFGKVTKGLDIVRKMESFGSGSGNTAMEVKISSCGNCWTYTTIFGHCFALSYLLF